MRTPVGSAWILADDEAAFRARSRPPAPARLLPSGDTYYLLWGVDRELLVPETKRRAAPPDDPRMARARSLVNGEIVGVWAPERRPWSRLRLGAASPLRNGRQPRPKLCRCRCRVSTVRLPSAGADLRYEGTQSRPKSTARPSCAKEHSQSLRGFRMELSRPSIGSRHAGAGSVALNPRPRARGEAPSSTSQRDGSIPVPSPSWVGAGSAIARKALTRPAQLGSP